jgi:hypothetical protein
MQRNGWFAATGANLGHFSLARGLQCLYVNNGANAPRRDNEMSAQDVKFLRIISATAAMSVGVSVTLGAAFVAAVSLIQAF